MENKLKKYGLDKIVLIILAGILLLLIALPQGNDNNTSKESKDGGESREEKLVRILEKRYGEGNIDVMLTETEKNATYFGEEESGTVTGVLVLVRTGNLEAASYDIVSAITALFDVPAHKVIVMEMK